LITLLALAYNCLKLIGAAKTFFRVEAETFNANNKKVLLYLSLVRPEEDLLDAAGEV
jgi:hypothetical protein